MNARPFDTRPCQLGEGPLWHPERNQLFWFDITAQRLLTVDGTDPHHWSFDDTVSAAGWIDHTTLLIASANGLWRFDIETGRRALLCPLEADNAATRSNDGRADPWGGFWIGTMGYNAEQDAGAIYRYYQGELRQLFDKVTVPNTICFAPDKSCAYFADTALQKIMKTKLDVTGAPNAPPEVFIDMRESNLNPDGAIVDADGTLWIALWGSGQVAAYGPDGSFQRAVKVPGARTTCPAFGGGDLRTLYVTSARQGLTQEALNEVPENGMTFAIEGLTTGLPEPRVQL